MKLNSTVDTAAGTLSLHVNVLTNIFSPHLMAVGYLDSGNNRYDLGLFNRTIDLCMFWENNRYEPLLQVAFKLLKKQISRFLPPKCPIRKVGLPLIFSIFSIKKLICIFVLKKLYSMTNVVINPDIFPHSMPEKKAFIQFTMMSKDDSIYKDLGLHSGYIRIEKIHRTKP